MADNYLERKQESLRSGPAVFRKTNPSLETMLHRLGATPTDPSYIVKKASLDALGRSAALAADAVPGNGTDIPASEASEGIHPLSIESDEAVGTLRISCNDPLRLGAATIAARLKASEMGLLTEVSRFEGGVILKLGK